ncbi:hypothetical protein KFE25_011345 [Diacronema lutheri]|uniref:Prostaglandin E synthase 2 n=1 Tax=Diacronema lutheri TaxID=2081491 RepID=A0A8J5XKP9_DIALT|nr:hypothetical protein KFE25_011345 [Diacronema lutheri]
MLRLRRSASLGRLAARAGVGVGGALALAGGVLELERRAVCQAKALTTAAAAATPPAAGGALASRALTLYQYEICPFCNKVKAVLDYFDVPYATVDVNPLTKAELKFSADYKKVPVLTAASPDLQLNDSADILAHVLTQLKEAGALPERAAFDSPEAQRWSAWVDKQLAVYIYPNITRSFHESQQAFAYVEDVPHFSALDKLANRYVGALAMVFAQGKIKKKYNIVDERAEMFAKLREWSVEVGDRRFHGGDQPDLADLSVYGCLRGIKATSTHAQIMAETDLQPWYQRVEAAVGSSSRISRT